MAKVITFGELMLRLQPFNYERFVQATSFEATVGGSWVCPKADVLAGNWEKITQLCIDARKAAKGE